MADENLKVDAGELGSWGLKMLTYSMSATMPAEGQLTQMGPAATSAFTGANRSGEFFAEGAVMHAGVSRQAAAFAAFLADLGSGLQAIGNAANVLSHAYAGQDVTSAEKMNLLGYAFATDPQAKAPDGLPKGVGDTMLDLQNESGQSVPADAEVDAEGGQSISFGGGMLTMYPDGSSRMVRTETVDGVPRSVTTITGVNGALLGTTTVGYTSNPKTGLTTESYRQVVTPGGTTVDAEGKKEKAPDRVTTTKTVTAGDGSKTITTEVKVGESKNTSEVHVDAPTKREADKDEITPLQEAQLEFPGAVDVNWKKGYQHALPSS